MRLTYDEQVRIIREVRALRDLEDVVHCLFAGPPPDPSVLPRISAALRACTDARKRPVNETATTDPGGHR